ncbi:MAG: 50S ribosomal protein L13 [Candidatus Thermoplasmatota archaeon]|nr:50S ribosomal protein L13 [Candidatus Thermoplasmatota archaeon]MCL5888906.1 50S ribosomal protein L13 [Candidatus Thermoplasmatota archaeon]
MIYVDANNLVYGRLSTIMAKKLLAGESVVIVNAANVAVTGGRDAVLGKFRARRDIGSVRKGPYYPRNPKAILKRSIGDMLPKDKARGKEALKRCIVYDGVPADLKDKQFEKFEKAQNNRVSGFVTLREVAEIMGKEVKVIE